MSAQSFSTYLPGLRDRGMELTDSWRRRYGTGPDPEDTFLEITALTPLYEMTTFDLLWCMVAAASDPDATHLELYVFPARPSDQWCSAKDVVEDLLDRFETEYGFGPFEYGMDFGNPAGEFSILIALFSESESERACRQLYRRSS